MLLTVALVGRPNVGKSTLFNQLTRSRDALVANLAGLTRDRKYGEVEHEERKFFVVDTGGLTGEEEGIDTALAEQSLLAIDEADIVVFIVDGRAGLSTVDVDISKYLRRSGKKVMLVVNKVDGLDQDTALAAFYELGLADLYPVAASHGRGVRHLLDCLVAIMPEPDGLPDPVAKGVKIAIVGRPNVGKSTLTNRMLGEDRVVVYDQPGTTRDSTYIDYERNGEPYTIIDTAGIRRRKNISETVEKFSIVKTLQAIDDANVVVLLMDASEGVVDQDLHLLGQVLNAGRALVVALNKWDGLDSDKKERIKSELDRRLQFIDFADIHYISALHGTGVGNLYESISKAYKSATERFSSSVLTRILESAVREHQPPLVRGRRIKLRYAHAGGHNPPIIVIHGNQTTELPGHYVRYLEKTFRRMLSLHGTPLKMEFKTGDNPFAGRKKVLPHQQASKKRRLIRQLKKKK